jgi:citronellol/citronellal dehydrogenase
MSTNQNFKDKTVFITGSTRGIGLAIGLKMAAHGANVVITGKTTSPHPKLEGTIYQAAEQIESLGAKALALPLDIREEEQVADAIEQTVGHFGGIDILVNNASAIQLTDTLHTDMKRFDLMHQVNTRGTFLVSKYAIPHLLKASNPHILTLSPPMQIGDHWFGQFLPYTLAKYGMTLVTRGLAVEFKDRGLAVNALWPRTTIATAAVRNLLGGDTMIAQSRWPSIMADAAYEIFQRPSTTTNGNYFIDEEVLRSAGIEDFEVYAVTPGAALMPDIFLD